MCSPGKQKVNSGIANKINQNLISILVFVGSFRILQRFELIKSLSSLPFSEEGEVQPGIEFSGRTSVSFVLEFPSDVPTNSVK